MPRTWPAEWRRRRGTVVGLLALMGLGVMAAVGALASGDVARDGRALIVVGLAPAVAAIGVVIVMQHLTPRGASVAAMRTTRVDEAPAPGLMIPYRRGLAVARAVAAGLVLVVGLVLVLAGVVGMTRSADGALSALLLGAIAIVGATGPLASAVTGRGDRRALILTHDGVVHRTLVGEVAAPWWTVVDVVPVGAVPAGIAIVCRPGQAPGATTAALGGAAAPTRGARSWRARLDPSARFLPDIVVSGADLAVDPVLVLRVIELYVRRPELRAELGTDSALTRASTMTSR